MTKIRNEKSSEFMKNLDGYDYVFENTKDEKEFTEDQTLNFAERFANQRVIDELERMNNTINSLDDANMVLQLRIKELKQE